MKVMFDHLNTRCTYIVHINKSAKLPIRMTALQRINENYRLKSLTGKGLFMKGSKCKSFQLVKFIP